MLGGQVALGDADEAGQPGLGRQQIVEVGVQAPVVHAVADGQQLAILIEQEAELHRVEHGPGGVGHRVQPIFQRDGRQGRLLKRTVSGAPGTGRPSCWVQARSRCVCVAHSAGVAVSVGIVSGAVAQPSFVSAGLGGNAAQGASA